MEYELVLTDKYLSDNEKNKILFEIKRIDNKPIDSYNNLIGLLPTVKIENYPSFLFDVSQEFDYSQMEYSQIIFGEYKDEDGQIKVPLNYVGFNVMDDITLTDKSQFFNLVLQFAEKALKGVNEFQLIDKKIVDDNWVKSIIEIIPQIKLKIEQYSFLQKNGKLVNSTSSNLENTIRRKKLYKFYDGLKTFNIDKTYDNWLSSTDFKVYSKSYIEYDNNKIELFSKQTKKIDRNSTIAKETLEYVAEQFGFVFNNKDEFSFYNEKYKYDTYYLVSQKYGDSYLLTIFSLGGTKSPESITIYGLWESPEPLWRSFERSGNE
ncbi:hypothetical protein ACJRPK_16030 [Aquimarina sp. 2-A2]|uniref:hypothetical protein n=1 Tax=Aquimarina sp. 2-A2 TaxID=3382644 RepID=UPI00387F147F